MRYSVESFDEVIEDIVPLLVKHWEEIALNKDKVPLAPNYERYAELNEQGVLDIFTAREDDENTLVGYCITLTTPHLHYWTTVTSSVDLVYVAPKYRGRMAGVRLMKFTEEQLKEKGAKVIMHHVKKAHDFGPILIRMGYDKVESIYGKYIGD